MDQVALCVFSLLAVFFANCHSYKWCRWGSICGLIAQPFWMVTTFEAAQWGIFITTVAYTCIWLSSFHHYWIKGYARKRSA